MYLITSSKGNAYITDAFDPRTDFNVEMDMIVYDLVNYIFTTDGKKWREIVFAV